MPDGTSRGSPTRARPIFHYMGCSTFSNYTVLPEIAVAKIRDGRALRQGLLHRLRRDHRRRRGGQHRQGRAGRQRRRVRPGRHRPQRHPGAKLVGAQMIVGVDINPDARGLGPAVRHDPFRQSEDRRRRPRRASGGADRRRRGLHLRLHRQHRRSCARRWRPATAAGARASSSACAEAGKEIATRPFQLVTGRVWNGTAFGGARGRTDVPKIVDWYMDGKIEIDPMITHTMPLERINEAFDLMHAGESIRSVVVY